MGRSVPPFWELYQKGRSKHVPQWASLRSGLMGQSHYLLLLGRDSLQVTTASKGYGGGREGTPHLQGSRLPDNWSTLLRAQGSEGSDK